MSSYFVSRRIALAAALVSVTAAAGLAGALAGVLGFNSLGQRRNTKQGRSWLGMASGALVVVGALVLFYAWRILSEPIIRELG